MTITQELRTSLKQLRQSVSDQFSEQLPVEQLVSVVTKGTDDILLKAWCGLGLHDIDEVALIAIGGYGRRELLLYSDIDLLVLTGEHINQDTLMKLEQFIRISWDIGMDVGHSIRSLPECIEVAEQDIMVISNLLETRLLNGDQVLYQALMNAITTDKMWASNKFFQAKWKEQLQRYKRYGETAYNLEPNTKNSPGGLRDLQMIGWVAKRHYQVESLEQLVTQKVLIDTEYQTLIVCRDFLWRVRFALHVLSGKREDRLLFDYQKKIALLFGYQDQENKLAIEQFMRDYFRVIKMLRELNDTLLQYFRETIIYKEQPQITPLNERFQICNRYIETTHAEVFSNNPSSLLEIFLLMALHPEIQGVRANTIRLIRQAKYMIDEQFRRSPSNQQIFMRILCEAENPSRLLQRMNRYGVLGNYIPVFGQVIGQMQYDLFHAYTVDQHTIFMIRNLCRFRLPESKDKFTLCHIIMQQISKPEILYLAALFHDIAKGRGGDHSELGALDAKQFCQQHDLSSSDTELIVWLVENHLLMSLTAQRKDIYDPETINEFVAKVSNMRYLQHLYLLTVADICATNPNLWNDFKESLLRELYRQSAEVISQQRLSVDEVKVIEIRQRKAMKKLVDQGFDSTDIQALWSEFKSIYFLSEPSAMIATHTKAILQHQQEKPLILSMQHHILGGTEFFIYMKELPHRFAITTAILSNLHLNILEARILTCRNGYVLDTFIVLNRDHKPVTDKHVLQEVKHQLHKHLHDSQHIPRIHKRRMSRYQLHFQIPTQVIFYHEENRQRTRMFLISADRPGLLAYVGKVFVECEVNLITAKITTVGERVEDMFYITNADNQPITDKNLQAKIREKINNYLE